MIIKPVLTEKSISLYKNEKIASFHVSHNSTKTSISESIFLAYGFRPKKVSILNKHDVSKIRFKTGRVKFKRSYFKKAYVWINSNKLEEFEDFIKE